MIRWIFPAAGLLLLTGMLAPIIAVLVSMSPADAMTSFDAAAQSALRVSLVASLSATAIATVLGVPAGYWLAHARGVVRAVALFLLALPLAFPPVASGLMLIVLLGTNAPAGGWLAAHGLRVPDTLAGVTVAEFFVSGSFVTIAATAAFATIEPVYADAARTLGAGEWRIFARVALPAAAGNVLAGVTFAWLRAIGEYGATSVLAYHPTSLPVALYVSLSAQGVRQALALCYGFVVLAVVALLFAWILRRRVVP